MRLGVLTDLHLAPAGSPPDAWHNPLQLDDVAERLRRSLTWLREQEIDRLAVLGDLTHHGDTQSTRIVLEILGERGWPVWLLPGNHDIMPDPTTLGLAWALAVIGRPWLELLRDVTEPLDASWSAVSFPIEHAAGTYRAAGFRALPTPDVDPLLVLSHFPVLALRSAVEAAGLKYAGDLENVEEVRADLLDRAGPTIVIHGHLHLRHALAHGPVLQISCAAQIEPPFDATVVDFEDWGDGRVSWLSASMQEIGSGVVPVLAEPRQAWQWTGMRWQSVNETPGRA